MGSLYIFCILCSKTPRFWDLILLFKIVIYIYIVGPNNAMFVLRLSLDIISIEFQKIFVIKKLNLPMCRNPLCGQPGSELACTVRSARAGRVLQLGRGPLLSFSL